MGIDRTAASAVAARPLLAVSDLRVSFPVIRGGVQTEIEAVRGVSFSVEEGGSLAVVGESGSGKTVSTSAVPGLLPPHARCSGSITYDGAELLGLPLEELRLYRGGEIAMVFQEPGRSFDPLQNIGSVFAETLRNSDKNRSSAEIISRSVSLLEEVGLQNAASRLGNFPHQFSGGQLQRISIALALAQGCRLLIADEPTTALDVTIQAQIVDLLKRLKRQRSLSVVFISHNIELAADVCERMMVLYGGLVMESGPSSLVVGAPLHPYSKALLAAMPVFGDHYTRRRLSAIPGKVTDPASPEPGCPFAPRCAVASAECSRAVPPLTEIAEGRFVRCVRCAEPQNETGGLR